MKKIVTPLVVLLIIIGLYLLMGYNKILAILILILGISALIYNKRAFLYTIKGNKAYSLGVMDEALANYKKAAEIKNCSPNTKRVYSYLLLKEKNVSEAEKIITKSLSSLSDSRDINLAKQTYSLIKWKQGKLDDAVNILFEVYNEFKMSTLYENLGYLLILKEDYSKALEINLEAYEYDGSDNIILDNLGETYYHLKEFEKSYDLYSNLIDKDPNFPEPYYHFGLVLKEKGDYEKSLDMFTKALTFKESFLSEVSHEKINNAINELKQLQN